VNPSTLSDAIRDCLRAAVAEGDLDVPVPGTVRVERPRQRAHGDWTTNVALQLAKQAGRPPREVAGLLAARLGEVDGIKSIDVAGPGFVNITLDAASAGELARTIVRAGADYGHGDAFAGQRVNLEFVSANPTGPIHLGGTRWAAVGDSLARILAAGGAEVTREYYFNDHGGQIDRFARSLLARARGEETPGDGYAGQYIEDIAARVIADIAAAGEPNPLDLPADQAQEVFRARGVDLMFTEIKSSLHDFGVDFDVYFHENDVHTSGAVTRAVDRLRDLGHIDDRDGAVWLRSTDLGDDKDRVIMKSDGSAAYFAGDLAYYLDKRERGFDRVIIMLGADHHGYIGRMMAMCAAFGDAPGENLEILIGQMVNLVSGGQPVRMSKRAGTVVTLEDLVEAVGVDAARYALARSSADSSMDVDLDLLVRRSNDNPVYYVQYVHARISGIVRNARDIPGLSLDPAVAGSEAEDAAVSDTDTFDPSALTDPTEAVLLAALGEFPRIVAQAGQLREPHRVARYLEELSGHFHKWYDACRVIPQGEDPVTEVNRARLWLAEATRTVIANGLDLLGVSAPERM
jgi:arginyl-tRNA synthetase